MSAGDQEFYLMTDKDKKDRSKEKEEEYDTDLERTLYQEFWSEIKPKPKREAQSVLKPGKS